MPTVMQQVILDVETQKSFDEVGGYFPDRLGISFVGVLHLHWNNNFYDFDKEKICGKEFYYCCNRWDGFPYLVLYRSTIDLQPERSYYLKSDNCYC